MTNTTQPPRTLRPTLNLTTARPTREIFPRHYVTELRAHGYGRDTPDLIGVLAHEVGLEPREIAHLQWKQINFDEQLIHATPSARRIALTKRSADLLTLQRKTAPSWAAFVFPSTRPSGHVTVRSIRRVLSRK